MHNCSLTPSFSEKNAPYLSMLSVEEVGQFSTWDDEFENVATRRVTADACIFRTVNTANAKLRIALKREIQLRWSVLTEITFLYKGSIEAGLF